ncbi:hypothetical protein HZC30_06830 [Candidatus Woesearchaeota archaeon]|nr:hypothetical protein [Candidatus Woesearchaeota archaeon]
MVTWFERLKAHLRIDKVELNLVKINITSSNCYNRTNIAASNKESYLIDKGEGDFNLLWDKIPPDKKPEIKQIVQSYISEEGNKLLMGETSELLDNLYQYNQNNINDKQVLNFFKNNIPFNDLEALESALFLRFKFRKGEDIKKLKADIRSRFGDRGNNICNLCTAGYFEEFLIPLYNSSRESFDQLYELIITNFLLAIFVHQGMEQDEVKTEIDRKIKASKKYGIKFVHIHGIGERNINKIRECVTDNESPEYLVKEIFKKDNILIIELLLK